MISVGFQGNSFNITVIQVYAPTSNAEEAEVERFYEDLQYLLELTPRKDVLFSVGDWNAKGGSQKIPGITGKFSLGVQNEAGQKLIEFCQENALVIVNTLFQQHMDITRWLTLKSDWLYSLKPKMEKLYTVRKNKTRGWLWLKSWTPFGQFRLKLKKVGKTTRPFRYDLNQISYDYTMEVRKRFKGLDLIDKSAWWTMDRGSWYCTEGRDQDHPQEKEMQKGKMVAEEALQIAVKRREAKGKGERKDIHIWMQSSKE